MSHLLHFDSCKSYFKTKSELLGLYVNGYRGQVFKYLLLTSVSGPPNASTGAVRLIAAVYLLEELLNEFMKREEPTVLGTTPKGESQ